MATLPSGKYKVLTGSKPCGVCNGAEVAVVNAGPRGGASFGMEYDHAPDCSTRFCPHGKPWAEECVICDGPQEEFDDD